MYYKCHKINLNCGGSYIDFLDWIKSKKGTINPINRKDKKCFQYAVTFTLNHEEIGKNPERITTIKPFINRQKLEEINFPSKEDDWEKFEKNNVTIFAKIFVVLLCLLKTLKY